VPLICFNVLRMIETHRDRRCSSLLQQPAISAAVSAANNASLHLHAAVASMGGGGLEGFAFPPDPASKPPPLDSLVECDTSVGQLFANSAFQEAANWFRVVLTLMPFLALLLQIPFPVIALVQTCGVVFVATAVFLDPSRFLEASQAVQAAVPWENHVISPVRATMFQLNPLIISLVIVYCAQRWRLRLFATMHQRLAPVRAAAAVACAVEKSAEP